MSRLIKNKDEAIFKLEEKAARFEGEMHKEQERYRELDNQRQRKFFFKSRFDEDERKFPGQGPVKKDVKGAISSAGALSQTGT